MLLLFAAAAPGGELFTPGEQVLRDLRLALSQESEEEAVALLGEVARLVHYPASAAEAAALLDLAGRATRAKSTRIVVAALHALGDAGAPEGAGVVAGFLQSSKPRDGEEEVMIAAIRAAGRLRAAALVPRLVDLARKSPDMTMADQAFVALGEFCHAPPDLRRQVTEKVLDACDSLSRRRARWQRLRAPGLRALQRLMGRRLNSVDQFAAWWKVVRANRDPFAPAPSGAGG